MRSRTDGRLSLAGPGATPGSGFGTTPGRRRPRAPVSALRPPRRLPYVDHATYGFVFVRHRRLEPGSLYEALYSMRRVCSCNPTWVKYYHEDMGWGPFVDRPCVCACPWRHGEYRPEWPWGVIDHVGPGYEPHVRPADSLRAEGYPDDPAIVDKPYQIGLFFGAPQLRRTGPTLFPPPAPGPPSVTLRVPASSSSSASLFPPGGDWQGIIAHLAEEPGDRAGEDRQDDGGESSRARSGDASGRDYPTAPQVMHREGPREGVGYAYRGTIVGEASNPGLADPGAVLRGRRSTAARCWDLTDLGDSRVGPSGWGGRLWPARWASRGTPVVGRRLPMATGASLLLAGTDWIPRVGGLPPRLARWASPGAYTGVLPLASIGRGRARVPVTDTGVSLLVRPLTFGLSHPPLTSRVPHRRGRF